MNEFARNAPRSKSCCYASVSNLKDFEIVAIFHSTVKRSILFSICCYDCSIFATDPSSSPSHLLKRILTVRPLIVSSSFQTSGSNSKQYTLSEIKLLFSLTKDL